MKKVSRYQKQNMNNNKYEKIESLSQHLIQLNYNSISFSLLSIVSRFSKQIGVTKLINTEKLIKILQIHKLINNTL